MGRILPTDIYNMKARLVNQSRDHLSEIITFDFFTQEELSMTGNYLGKLIIFLLAFSLPGYPLLVHAQETSLDPSRVKWSSLHYKTYIVFFSMNVKARLNLIPQTDSKAALLTPEHGQATMPLANPTYRIDLDSKIMGRKSLISLWFDPDGSAFQRTQTDTGSKQRIKTYRILKDGYVSQQVKPKKNEKDQPPAKWTEIGKGHKTFKTLPPAGTIIAEPTALYYLLSASTLNKPGDKFEKYIFTKHGIFLLKLHAVDHQEIEADYVQQQEGKKLTTRGEIKTLHIRMNATPLDPAEAADFDFLGLKGDIHLYMEPTSRVLLQISGKADIIGHTDIKLKEVVF